MCIYHAELTKCNIFFVGFGIAVMVAIVLFVLVGFCTYFFVKNKSENYFVAGRSLPLWVVTATLASQSIDSNAILGNADLSYKYHYYDGAVLPIGLGLSLILNGIFLAAKINKDGALTLPDVFAKRYGKVVEVLCSICTIISFLCLLAGNLVGMGVIISYTLGLSEDGAIWVSMVAAITINKACRLWLLLTFLSIFRHCSDGSDSCAFVHYGRRSFLRRIYGCNAGGDWMAWMRNSRILHDCQF